MKWLKNIAVILFFGSTLFTSKNALAQVSAAFNVSQTEGCSPLVIRFTDQSTDSPTQWQWRFGNGNGSNQQNPSAIYTQPGQYTVQLIASNNSSSDTTIQTAIITVFHDPAAQFTLSDSFGCIPKSIQFTDLSTEGDAPIDTWNWDFGDGNLSNDPNPNHTFTNPGNYTIVLGVRDTNGCSNQYDIPGVEILPRPNADFSAGPTDACSAPLNTIFNNQSSSNGAVSYQWDFGDGSTSTDENPNHTYTANGAFNVELIVTDASGCSDTILQNDLIHIDNVIADFNQDDQNICTGETVNFTSTSSPDIDQNFWDFGDGSTSNGDFTAHTYSDTGYFNVQLISENIRGCRDTLLVNDAVHVQPTPLVSIDADTTEACSYPLTVQFSNNTQFADAYFWNFGDGNTSSDPNPSHTYTSEGDFDVTLTTINAAGCSETITFDDFIEIEEPNVWFRANERDGCVNLTIDFEDRSNSNDPIVSWFWDFGDGNTSTAQDPTHTYTSEGVYDVSLTITNSKGCTETRNRNNFIRAGNPPNVIFGADQTFACLEEPIQFTDSTLIGDEWLWDFGDGNFSNQQNPSHTFSDTGSFTITLIVGNNGCEDTLVLPNYITINPPGANFDVTHNCIDPLTVSFTDQSIAPDNWWWNFGDGNTSTEQNPTHTYASRGDYTVTLAVEDTLSGCVDTLQQNIQMTVPEADFYADDSSGCAPFSTRFRSLATDADAHYYLASNGDQGFWRNPRLEFNDPGVYDVLLVVTDIHGCEDSILKENFITVYGAEARFEADSLQGCAPLLVQYQDSSTSHLGNIIAWNWNFGNGDSSNLPNPTQSYVNPGSYTIELTVTDDNGCTDTEEKINYVQPTFPDVAFTGDSFLCLNETAQFVNQSNGSGLQYFWSFGNGDSSQLENPSYTYSDTGSYDISLFVEDINGCSAAISVADFVQVVQPQANFTIDTNYASCPPLLVRFTDLSTDSILSWQWDFGDGQTSDLENPGHTYINAGVYYVSLTVENHLGCTSTYHYPDSIVVDGPSGDFDFIQNTTCIPAPVEFFSNADSNMIHIWDFGNGHVEVGNETITYPYNETGVFYPTLILDDGRGCVISIPHPDSIVTTDVTAGFIENRTKICGAATVQFTDTSSAIPSGLNWYWDFGDGNTSTDQNPAHVYNTPGIYTVQLIAENSFGCRDTMTKTDLILVDEFPVADFQTSDSVACAPALLNFNDQSVSATNIVSWEWDFGDGNFSTDQNPNHTYTHGDSFNIRLVVENIAGCRDSIQKNIQINERPSIALSNDTAVCEGSTVQLGANGGIAYQWTPSSDLSCANCPNPSLIVNQSNIYEVEVTNPDGCNSRDTLQVNAMPYPVLAINNDTTVCAGSSIQVNASRADQYNWTSAATLDCNNCNSPSFIADQDYTLSVEASSNFGCSVQDSFQVQTRSVEALFSPSDTVACVPENIQFSDQSSSNDAIISWNWDFGNGLQSNLQNPSTDYTTEGLFEVQLMVTTQLGCQDSFERNIRIHPLPVADAGPDTSICIDESVQLNGSGGVNYNWSPASSLNDSTIVNPLASPLSTTNFSLTVTDANGCQNTDQVQISINPLPVVNVSPDTNICLNDSIQLWADGGEIYNWTPSQGLSNPSIANPIASPQSNTLFEVMVTDSNGCVNSGQLNLDVFPLPQHSISPDDAVCLGEQSTLQVSGGSHYQWLPSNAVDCDTCASTATNIQATQLFDVIISNTYGCSVEDSVLITVNPLPQLAINPDTGICFGSSVELIVSGADQYHWNSTDPQFNCNNCSSSVIQPIDDAQYFVEGENQYGCTSNDTVNVDVFQYEAAINLPDSTVCFPDSLKYLDASFAESGIASWNWDFGNGDYSSNQNTQYAHPQPGYYPVQLSIISNENCRDTAYQNVRIHALPEIIAGPDTSICRGDSVQLFVSGGQDYQWFPINLQGANSPFPMAAPQQDQNYLVLATDSNGCKGSDTASISVLDKPNIIAGPDTIICKNNAVQLQSKGGISYEWQPHATLSALNTNSPLAIPDSSTQYQVRGYDENGCFNDAQVVVEIYPTLRMDIRGDSMICGPGELDLRVLGGQNHQWYPQNQFSCQSCNQGIFQATQSEMIYVEAESRFGCPMVDSMQVVVLPKPNLDLEDAHGICQGESLQLNASVDASVSIQWTNTSYMDDSNSLSPTVSPLSSTTFAIEVENNYGCKQKDSTTVFVLQKLQTNIGNDTAVCYGQAVQLKAVIENSSILNEEVTYTWFPLHAFENPYGTEQVFTPENDGEYYIVSNSGRCAPDTQRIKVQVNTIPTVDVGEDQRAYSGEELELLARTNAIVDSFHWHSDQYLDCNNCENPILTVEKEGPVAVFIEDINGCTARDSFKISLIESCEDEMYLPNTFTPNNDEANDIFRVRYRTDLEIDFLRIFDRWGNLVYESDDIDEGWDGRHNGNRAQIDVYAYYLRAQCPNGKYFYKKGNVTLLR